VRLARLELRGPTLQIGQLAALRVSDIRAHEVDHAGLEDHLLHDLRPVQTGELCHLEEYPGGAGG